MSTLVSVECSHCKAVLKSRPGVVGRIVDCPKCGKPFMAELAGIGDPSEEEGTFTPMPYTVPPKRELAMMPEWFGILLLVNSIVTAIYFSMKFLAVAARSSKEFESTFVSVMGAAWAYGFFTSMLSGYFYRASLSRTVAFCIHLVPVAFLCFAMAVILKAAKEL